MKSTTSTTRRRLIVPAYFVHQLRGTEPGTEIAFPLKDVAKLMGLPYETARTMAHRGEIPLVGFNTGTDNTGPTAA